VGAAQGAGQLVKRLIVDGYNVIGRASAYGALAENDLDAARAALVSDVAAFAHGEYAALVVFDGGGNPHSTGQAHDIAGVEVVFSSFGVDADTVIERETRAARELGDDVTVVTSDAQLQWTVMGGSTVRMSADEFSRELSDGSGEWREHAPSGSAKGTLDERIDPEVRDVLSRWARGLD